MKYINNFVCKSGEAVFFAALSVLAHKKAPLEEGGLSARQALNRLGEGPRNHVLLLLASERIKAHRVA